MKATIFDGKNVQNYDVSQSAALGPDTPYVWVDVQANNLADPQLHTLLTDLGIDSPILAYLKRSDLAGTFRITEQHVIGSTWAAPDVSSGKPVYVHVVWSSGSIVTLRTGGDKAMAQVMVEMQDRGEPLFAHPTIVPGVLLDLILSSVDRRLTQINDEIYHVDEAVMISTNNDQVAKLRAIRDEINPWGRRIPPYQENLNEAFVGVSKVPGIDSDGAHYLQAYSAHVGGLVTTVGDAVDNLHSTVQDYQAELSNRQGNRINQLTVVATIFLPITFMTGYFGMNFQWLTDATLSFGAWFALGVVMPVALLVLSVTLLRRRGFGAWLLGGTDSSHPQRKKTGAT